LWIRNTYLYIRSDFPKQCFFQMSFLRQSDLETQPLLSAQQVFQFQHHLNSRRVLKTLNQRSLESHRITTRPFWCLIASLSREEVAEIASLPPF